MSESQLFTNRPLTAEEVIAFLLKLPRQTAVRFYSSPDQEFDNEMNEAESEGYEYSSEFEANICFVEHRTHECGDSEIYLHGSQPNWDLMGVVVLSDQNRFIVTKFIDN